MNIGIERDQERRRKGPQKKKQKTKRKKSGKIPPNFSSVWDNYPV